MHSAGERDHIELGKQQYIVQDFGVAACVARSSDLVCFRLDDRIIIETIQQGFLANGTICDINGWSVFE